MDNQPDKPEKTLWHRILGKVLEELLPPVGISVFTEYPLMSAPLKSDILILKNQKGRWTKEQMKRLPDGIRDTDANRILIEFKYSESVSKNAFMQASGYDCFYKSIQNLKAKDVGTFLVSAKTPRDETLTIFSYESSVHKGVYCSSNPALDHIGLLVLNELSDAPHNAYIKCFASRKKEKFSAFATLQERFGQFDSGLVQVLKGLITLWINIEGGATMKGELTPEKIIELGKQFESIFLTGITPEEILEKYGKERLLEKLKPQERLEGLKPQERLEGLKPQERLEGLKPQERLEGLSVEEIEAYLEKLKKKK